MKTFLLISATAAIVAFLLLRISSLEERANITRAVSDSHADDLERLVKRVSELEERRR